MGPAYELEFTTEDFFQLPDNELVGEIGFIQYGMRYLAPRQKNKHRLGRIWSKGNEYLQTNRGTTSNHGYL